MVVRLTAGVPHGDFALQGGGQIRVHQQRCTGAARVRDDFREQQSFAERLNRQGAAHILQGIP